MLCFGFDPFLCFSRQPLLWPVSKEEPNKIFINLKLSPLNLIVGEEGFVANVCSSGATLDGTIEVSAGSI